MTNRLAFPVVLALVVPLRAQAHFDAAVPPPPGFVTRDVDVGAGRALVGGVQTGGVGVVLVYERQPSGEWLQVSVLDNPTQVANDQFGKGVSLSGDRALVGASNASSAHGGRGVCYVFERQSDGTWSLVASFDDGTTNSTAAFGWDVALEHDRAVVGDCNRFWTDGATGLIYHGAVYVFERQSDGQWIQVAQPIPASPDDGLGVGANILAFATSVDLSGDFLVAGRPEEYDTDHLELFAEGAAYVFERQRSGDWVQAARLEAQPEVPNGHFGGAVAIDGDRAIIGLGLFGGVLPGAGHPGGFAHVFERQPDGSWESVDRLEAPAPTPGDNFGFAVAIEGDRAVVGAPGAGGAADAAYVYDRRPDGSWNRTVELAGGGSHFGIAVALDQGRAVIGSPYTATYFYETGSLYRGQLTLSVELGGGQDLYLRAGAEHAGDVFVLLGSISGTSPGIVVDDVVVPLVADAYTLLLLDGAGAGLVSPFVGLLDAQGAADAAFTLPAGSNPALAGLVLHHAFVAIDVAGSGDVELASNAARLELVP